jgi:hypothetical protein
MPPSHAVLRYLKTLYMPNFIWITNCAIFVPNLYQNISNFYKMIQNTLKDFKNYGALIHLYTRSYKNSFLERSSGLFGEE